MGNSEKESNLRLKTGLGLQSTALRDWYVKAKTRHAPPAARRCFLHSPHRLHGRHRPR